MIKLFYIVVLISLLFGNVGLPLQSQIAFNTKPFPCTEEYSWRTLEWTNTGTTKLVRKTQVWGGMGEGNIADLGFFIVKKSDNTNLAIGNQDHYKDGEFIQMIDFSPDYILLKHGEILLLGYQCNVWGERTGKGHFIITMWYFNLF